jgi:hypothetical protein
LAAQAGRRGWPNHAMALAKGRGWQLFNLQVFFFFFFKFFEVLVFTFKIFFIGICLFGRLFLYIFSKKLKTKNEVGNDHSIGQTIPKANHLKAGQRGWPNHTTALAPLQSSIFNFFFFYLIF